MERGVFEKAEAGCKRKYEKFWASFMHEVKIKVYKFNSFNLLTFNINK